MFAHVQSAMLLVLVTLHFAMRGGFAGRFAQIIPLQMPRNPIARMGVEMARVVASPVGIGGAAFRSQGLTIGGVDARNWGVSTRTTSRQRVPQTKVMA